MKFDVDDKNRCRLVCVKFHLNRCRFAAADAKCLGGSLFWDTVYVTDNQLWITSRGSWFRFTFITLCPEKMNNLLGESCVEQN